MVENPDFWQWLVGMIQTQGLAVFLVLAVTILAAIVVTWLMRTVYPDQRDAASRTLDVRLAEAEALKAVSEATELLTAAIAQIHRGLTPPGLP